MQLKCTSEQLKILAEMPDCEIASMFTVRDLLADLATLTSATASKDREIAELLADCSCLATARDLEMSETFRLRNEVERLTKERDNALEDRALLRSRQGDVMGALADAATVSTDPESFGYAIRQLTAERDALAARLAEIAAGAQADADDLDKMRDGTKLTRRGCVEIIVYQQQEIAELKLRLSAIESKGGGK